MARRRKTEYRRALEFAVVLAVLGGVFATGSVLRGHATRAVAYAACGVAALLVALVARRAWIAVFRIWMTVAEALGRVMTLVALSLFYFLVLTPVGLVSRRFGSKPLDTSFKDGRSTYWVDRDSVPPSIERYAKRY
ncbi:MAG TPA: SxtJ family membrane protein [Candidatus Sulfotelmatobacter sp.]|jgi:hypothetical protein|nr:SxtJ family membrane protein [Candidatus Sulfotelmatobacter sp.]